jgi:alkylation response protein AidB-like acyl-CoA dehydrogenase
MQFELDTEQRLLSDSVSRFLQNGYAFETRTNLVAAGAGGSVENWRTFAEAGWLAAALPETYGGLGGSVIETAIISQQFGRSLVIEPYLGCAVLAAQTFAAAATPAQCEAWIPTLSDGSRRLALAYGEAAGRGLPEYVSTRADRRNGGYRLTGRKTLVLGGPTVDLYVVSANEGARKTGSMSLFLVPADAAGLTVARAPLHDGRMAAELTFNDVRVDTMLGAPGTGLAALRHGLAHATISLCAELIGAMERTVEITAEYLRNREQFGTKLSSFQVLQHQMADMAAELELARSMLFAALAALQNDDAVRRREVLSAAKAFVSNAALNVCGRGIQLHGGIGMTEEYAVGHYFKRAVVNGVLLGANVLHEAACAAMLRDRVISGVAVDAAPLRGARATR